MRLQLSDMSARSQQNRRHFIQAATALSAAPLFQCSTSAQQADSGQELLFSSAMAMSRAIRSGQISSEEAVRLHLDRIQATARSINAVVTLCESAIEDARKADAELSRGEQRGILHGVPMTIKDSLDTEGVVTTAGTLGRRDFIPKRDATVVARLRAAGAILLGKTNTPEFTMSYDTRNLVFGFTYNPYNVAMSPGGSSGGAAAVVAVGGSPFDIGSDTGGSIRVPSAFCGVAGIKPTSGRVPLTGHIIRTGLGATDSQTQLGPIARFVDDLFPILKLIVGPDEEDPATVPVALRHPATVQLPSLRVAFHTNNGIIAASPDVKSTVESAARAMSELGASVTESVAKALRNLKDFIYQPDAIDGNEYMNILLKQSGTKRWDPHTDFWWQSPEMSGKEAGKVLRNWQQFRIDMHRWMRDFDVLLCPVHAQGGLPSGFPLEGETLDGFTYTAAYNYTGWPSAVVRCGTTADGMPIGIQIVSRPWREDICLSVAKHLETTLGGWQRTEI